MPQSLEWSNQIVRYILECVNNIIFLGKLTMNGYKFVGKNNQCMVYKKGRLVLYKWKIENNIYMLNSHDKLIVVVLKN